MPYQKQKEKNNIARLVSFFFIITDVLNLFCEQAQNQDIPEVQWCMQNIITRVYELVLQMT